MRGHHLWISVKHFAATRRTASALIMAIHTDKAIAPGLSTLLIIYLYIYPESFFRIASYFLGNALIFSLVIGPAR
ncbi:hypothetical protein [Pantoea sp. FN0305]|uniref:hypothetical protein n=1 Tax=Pantoea sp. FN0305 TaxID=3418559 RepID=UPI003CFACC2F